MGGSRGTLMGLAAAGFVLGVAALALVLTSDHQLVDPAVVALALTLGWSFIGTGLYAQWRRPGHVVGKLMTLTGFLWFLGALPEADSDVLYTLGIALGGLFAGPLVHLLVVFPSGRAAPGLERMLVYLGYTIAIAQSVVLLFSVPDGCARCPENLLLIQESETVETVLSLLFGLGGVAMLVSIAFVLIRRWRRAGRVQRRALSPVLWTGATLALVGIAGTIPSSSGNEAAADIAEFVLLATIAAVPFSFLVGLLRSSLSRAGAVSALVERVGTTSVRDALAQALGDPQLTLAYWLPRQGRYVDADGHPVTRPDDRAVTVIEQDGDRVAAIVHDPALLEQPELVRAAGAAAGLALRNERLDAELKARYEELRASQARLVAAGDAARRRIERDLHDGAQQRLVSLALLLRLAARRHPDDKDLERAAEELTLALHELRELARGIHPAVLTERGLEAAVAGIAARAPIPVTVTSEIDGRLPPDVESAAYFVISEALTNVAKYADATEAEVSVRQIDGRVSIEIRDDGKGGADPDTGSGLRGIADRLGALDGRLEVESPAGGGTHVRAELPTTAGARPMPAR
jgi:signal transduction histidine kinase